jgi:site-specific recombinase XerC
MRPQIAAHCQSAASSFLIGSPAIQGWLGHRAITSTTIYTALAPNRFKDFWRH